MKKQNKNLIIILISIILILFSYNTTSKANVIEESINIGSELIKQQSDDPYQDKPYSDEYLKYLQLSDEEKSKAYDIPRKEFIAVHKDINDSENAYSNNDLEYQSEPSTTDSSLPAKYNLKDNISIKVEDQKSSGWCWAYSSLKCLETYLQKNKIGNYNLAEYHLAYMRYKFFGGWQEMKQGEYSSQGEAAYNYGGTFEDFMKYTGVYSSKYHAKGAITGTDSENKEYKFWKENKESFENKTPAIKVNKVINFSYIRKEYSNNGTVTYYNGNTKMSNQEIQEFRKKIKTHIKSSGGIRTSTYLSSEKYFYNNKALYINNSDVESNHSVTIVGWDDNYSKTNFKPGNQPKNNGAWIVLNSYGSDWGEKGYFYISYDDALVEKWMDGVVSAKKYTDKPNLSYFTSPNGYTNGKVTVTITSDDRVQLNQAKANGWSVSYKESYPVTYGTVRTTQTILTKTFNWNETEEVKVKAVDGGQTNSIIVKVNNIKDTTPPSVAPYIEGIPTTWTKEPVTLTVHASDSQSGLHSKAYSFDGGKTWQASASYNVDKNKVVSIIVRDKYDNKSEAKQVTIDKIDVTSPKIASVKAKLAKGKQGIMTLTLNASDSGSGLNSKAYSFDGGKNFSSSKTKNISVNQGLVSIVVQDKVGNKAIKTIDTKTIPILGDFDKDRKVGISDLLLMKKYILTGKKLTQDDMQAVDFDNNKKLNIIDLLQEKKLILNGT